VYCCRRVGKSEEHLRRC